LLSVKIFFLASGFLSAFSGCGLNADSNDSMKKLRQKLESLEAELKTGFLAQRVTCIEKEVQFTFLPDEFESWWDEYREGTLIGRASGCEQASGLVPQTFLANSKKDLKVQLTACFHPLRPDDIGKRASPARVAIFIEDFKFERAWHLTLPKSFQEVNFAFIRSDIVFQRNKAVPVVAVWYCPTSMVLRPTPVPEDKLREFFFKPWELPMSYVVAKTPEHTEQPFWVNGLLLMLKFKETSNNENPK